MSWTVIETHGLVTVESRPTQAGELRYRTSGAGRCVDGTRDFGCGPDAVAHARAYAQVANENHLRQERDRRMAPRPCQVCGIQCDEDEYVSADEIRYGMAPMGAISAGYICENCSGDHALDYEEGE